MIDTRQQSFKNMPESDTNQPGTGSTATAPAAEPYGAYRFTSIARPVEPRFPTNRLVLQLLPVAAGLGFGSALYQGAGISGALLAALMFLLAAFASWALTGPMSRWRSRLPAWRTH